MNNKEGESRRTYYLALIEGESQASCFIWYDFPGNCFIEIDKDWDWEECNSITVEDKPQNDIGSIIECACVSIDKANDDEEFSCLEEALFMFNDDLLDGEEDLKNAVEEFYKNEKKASRVILVALNPFEEGWKASQVVFDFCTMTASNDTWSYCGAEKDLVAFTKERMEKDSPIGNVILCRRGASIEGDNNTTVSEIMGTDDNAGIECDKPEKIDETVLGSKDDGGQDQNTSQKLQIEDGVLVANLLPYCDEIIIPEGVVEIKESVFENNHYLKKVHSSSTCLRRIGNAAFKNCTFLEEVYFESIADEIGEEAFAYCDSLKKVTFSRGTFKVGRRAFADSKMIRSIVFPDGVTAIEDEAFIHLVGRAMLFVSIPPSVYDLSDRATDGVHYVLGDANTFLPGYCGKYEHRRGNFLENNEKNMKYLNDRLNLENAVDAKEFIVYGETITATNTLYLYQETVKYYEDKREESILRLIRTIPNAINGDLDLKPLEQLRALESEMSKRLEKFGIPKESVNPLNSTIAMLTLQQKYGSLLAVCKNMTDATLDYMTQVSTELSYEAESKVTGLSYGILTTSALDMIAYGIDEYRERKRQREAAFAEANIIYRQKASRAVHLMQTNFYDLAQKLVPSFEEATLEFINALIQDELEILDREGFIQKEIIESYDIAKSVSIIEQATRNSHIDKTKALASALRAYPNNKGAFSFARDNGIYNEEVEALECFFKVIEEAKAKEAAEAKAEAERIAKEKAEIEAKAREKEEALAQQRAAEEKKRQEERLANSRARYDAFTERIKEQKDIIATNSGWFGESARIRKVAQAELRSLENLRNNEFPNGRP